MIATSRVRASPRLLLAKLLAMARKRTPKRPDLSSSWAKLDRADWHLDCLNAEYRKYEATLRNAGDGSAPPTVATREPDLRTGTVWVVVRLGAVPAPPRRLGLMVGDAIHNTRSALDHLLCSLVRSGGRKGCSTENQFPVSIHEVFPEDNRLDGVPTWARDLILGMQPYADRTLERSKLLLRLADFDNADKHRSLHPLIQPTIKRIPLGATAVEGAEVPVPGVRIYSSQAQADSLFREGAELWRMRLPDLDMIRTVEVQVDFGVLFGAPPVSIPGIRDMVLNVRSIVRRFDVDPP